MSTDRLASLILLGLLVLALVMLGGCSGAVVVKCPALRDYPPAFQAAAAAQIEATIPPGSPVDLMMTDYGELRAAVRACR